MISGVGSLCAAPIQHAQRRRPLHIKRKQRAQTFGRPSWDLVWSWLLLLFWYSCCCGILAVFLVFLLSWYSWYTTFLVFLLLRYFHLADLLRPGLVLVASTCPITIITIITIIITMSTIITILTIIIICIIITAVAASFLIAIITNSYYY